MTPTHLEFENKLLKKGYQGELHFGASLADKVYYQIGGSAEIFADPERNFDIQILSDVAGELEIPLFILGSGTNILIPDQGLQGLVVNQGPKSVPPQILSQHDDRCTVKMSSRLSKFEALSWSLENSLEGLEFSAGIPGTLGGAVYMNAGTKWGSYGEIIRQVEFYNREKGFFSLKAEDIGFKYRGHGEGLFKDGTFVLSIDLELRKSPSVEASLKKIDEILFYRGSKQPLEYPSCGSVFKNPTGSDRGAGRLIEASGLKGFRIGQVQISKKHSNFFLNLGGGSSADVKNLIEHAQKRVLKDHGVVLEPEVIIL